MASDSSVAVAESTDRDRGADDGAAPCRPQRADARRNRESLVASASVAFARQGPDASLELIAKQAGVGIGTLYRHFPTREALMAAVVTDAFETLAARARDAAAAADPWAAVVDWAHAYLAFAATKRGLVAGIVLLREDGSDFGSLCERLYGGVDDLVRRAQEAGVMRAGVSGRDLLHLVSALAASGDRAEDPTLPDRLFEIALAGLRP